MYTVLIVEDETLVRIGIKASIDWGKYGMQIIGDAADGVSGLQVFKDKKPDILITDINLPRLNGIGLIEQAYTIKPDCAIIVISCVDDFVVLRKLMPYNIVDYLLKSSISTTDIEVTLVKIREKLDKLDINMKDRVAKEINANSKIKNYIIHNEGEDNNEELHIKKRYCTYMVCIYITNATNNKPIISKTIIELLVKYYRQHSTLINIQKNDCKILVMFEKEDMTKEVIYKQLMSFQKYVYRALNIDVFCCIENWSGDYQVMKQLFGRFCNYIDHVNISSKYQQIEDNYINNKYNEIKAYVKLTVNIMNAYLNIQHDCCVQEFIDLDKEQYNFEKVKEYIYSKFSEMQRRLHILSNQILQLHREELNHAKTYIDIYILYRNLLHDTKHHMLLPVHIKPEVMHVIQYISKDYKRHIYISQLADKVSLSTNYLSTVFKNEVGMSIVDYLTQYRVRKAMVLLEDTDDYLYEIAEKSGFTNECYFSKTFKKITSISPAKWRKSMKSYVKIYDKNRDERN